MSDAVKILCRDCFTWIEPSTDGPGDAPRVDRCPDCRGHRLLAHAELDTLSIAHLDCDAFYAAVEKRDDRDLTDKPLIIGGGKRGVVSTACYIARMYGVRSAMPMFKALKACPQAVVLKPNMGKYVEAGKAVRSLMEEITPLVQPLSLDEAFLDLTGTERLHGAPPAETLARLVRRIMDQVGVPVSVGLSHNKFLAKVASDLDKPRGFALIGQAETHDFLARQPISVIWGVGKATEQALAKDGLTHLRQIQKMEESDLIRRYGTMGQRLWRLAQGLDDRPVKNAEAVKSISSETTFHDDIADHERLRTILWSQCERVATRAKAKEMAGHVVTLKLKSADFKIRTRSRSLETPTQLAHVLFKHGEEMLRPQANGTKFRLLGIGLSGLTSAEGADQVLFLEPEAARRNQAERAMDLVRDKFGKDAVLKGRGLPPRS